MPDPNLLPIDAAHEILAVFGITEPTAVYERQVKPDGFDHAGLWDVIADASPFVFIIDHRAALPDELARIAPAVAELGAELTVDVFHGTASLADVEQAFSGTIPAVNLDRCR